MGYFAARSGEILDKILSFKQAMIWTDLVFLGVGLGLGIGVTPLLRQLSKGQGDESPVEAANQNILTLLAQLKQTETAYQLAREMSQFKAGFLARTTHELRSPLNSLIGLHQLILSDLCDDPAEEREFVAQAHESALKLLHLMDEILEVARIDHGTRQLEIQPLQLARVLQEVYQLTYLMAANRNLPLELVAPDPDAYLLADPGWLRQVLVSLLSHSIAQIEEGKIVLSAQPIPEIESVQIWLDLPLATSAWSEPVDSIQFEPAAQPVGDRPVSPGLKLMLHQTVLAQMQAHIEVMTVPTKTDPASCTRLQVTIPLVIPEAEPLEPEAN